MPSPTALASPTSSAQMVTATIDGQVVSWVKNSFGDATQSIPASIPPSAQIVTATIDGQVVSWVNNWFGPGPTNTPANEPTVADVTQPAKIESAGLLPKIQEE